MKNFLQWHEARIRAVRDITPTVREFEICPTDAAVVAHEAGAHLQMQLHFGNGQNAKTQTRSYSLVGEPDGQSYRIAVKRLDDGKGGSLAMWRLIVGDRLQISEPMNHFPLDTSASAYLIVAGGIGITPLVLMAQSLQKRALESGVYLRMLYGARSKEELAYLPTLQALLGEKLVVHVGASPIDFAAEIAALPPGAQVYSCGPVPMLEALKRAWAASQRPLVDLRFETFGSSGRYAAQAFTVHIPRQNKHIEVPIDASLLDMLELEGVQALYDCRRGECGLCAMEVLDVKGQIDHRDVFLSEHEKQQNQRICVCVSRVVGEVTLDSAYRPEA